MLRLAQKAFAPAPLPFPLLHIDTTWKFREMIAHRDRTAREVGANLIVHTNAEGLAQNVNPFDHGSNKYTTVMKTEALKQALTRHGVRLRVRRRSTGRGAVARAKEGASTRSGTASTSGTRRTSAPSCGRSTTAGSTSARACASSPCPTGRSSSVWLYLWTEKIPVVPLYLAKARPVVARSGTWIMVDDERMQLRPGEKPVEKMVALPGRSAATRCPGAVESHRGHGARGDPGDAPRGRVRAAGPAHRPRRGRVDGEEEARGVLLMLGQGRDRDLLGTDIEGYLPPVPGQGLLRFVAVGSVDDGKSTLIGAPALRTRARSSPISSRPPARRRSSWGPRSICLC